MSLPRQLRFLPCPILAGYRRLLFTTLRRRSLLFLRFLTNFAAFYTIWVLVRQSVKPLRFFSITEFLLIPRTYGTLPTLKATLRCDCVGVLRAKLMSLWTVRSASVGGDNTFPSKSILSRRYRLDVNGVYTMPNPTQMIALQFAGNGFHEQLVNEAMGGRGVSRSVVQPTITTPLGGSRPFPTRNSLVKTLGRYFDFGKDSGEKFAVDNATIEDSHNVSYTDVVVRLGDAVQARLRAVSILSQGVGL
jgi:hypothetical protein